MSPELKLLLVFVAIVVFVYVFVLVSTKIVRLVKDKTIQNRVEFNNTKKNLKTNLPGLFKKENWKVKSYESAIYKPTNEYFSWGDDYDGGYMFEFPTDIKRLLTEDEKYIVYCFLERLVNDSFKSGNYNDREDLVRKYG